jgi:hypothetical protein
METEWQRLPSLFTTVKNLFLEHKALRHVTNALNTLSEERIIGAFPALQNIFIEDLQSRNPFWKFTTLRQRAGFPVALHEWVRGK